MQEQPQNRYYKLKIGPVCNFNAQQRRDFRRTMKRILALAAVKGEGEDFDDGPPCPICGSKSHGYTGHTPNHD